MSQITVIRTGKDITISDGVEEIAVSFKREQDAKWNEETWSVIMPEHRSLKANTVLDELAMVATCYKATVR